VKMPPTPPTPSLKAPAGLGHDAGGENGARIHDEDGVVMAELREKTVEGPLQGPRFRTNDAGRPRRRGAVSASL
jgi:hypothetical protein